jgi:hypothetical protein
MSLNAMSDWSAEERRRLAGFTWQDMHIFRNDDEYFEPPVRPRMATLSRSSRELKTICSLTYSGFSHLARSSMV